MTFAEAIAAVEAQQPPIDTDVPPIPVVDDDDLFEAEPVPVVVVEHGVVGEDEFTPEEAEEIEGRLDLDKVDGDLLWHGPRCDHFATDAANDDVQSRYAEVIAAAIELRQRERERGTCPAAPPSAGTASNSTATNSVVTLDLDIPRPL